MYCPSCGFHNADGAVYCARCGAGLPVEQEPDETTVSYLPDEQERETVIQPPQEMPATGGASLVIRSGGGRVGESYLLTAPRTTIGRHPESTIFLDDVTVSRNHAVVLREGAAYIIVDQGSLNGTYVNRRRLEREILSDGDELQIGKYKLAFLAQ